jgi:hypothetical protein
LTTVHSLQDASGVITATDTEIVMALEDVVEDGADIVINSWGSLDAYAGGPYEYIPLAFKSVC